MPMAKSLGKVTKAVKKQRGAVHPKGRKFKMLNRASLREVKLEKTKMKALEKKGAENLIYYFFQQAIQTPEYVDRVTFSVNEIKTFIEAFVSRDDEELDELKAERRPGRPPTARQQLLEERTRRERHMYQTGWPVPNLQDEASVKYLRNWNGSTGGLTVIQKITISESA